MPRPFREPRPSRFLMWLLGHVNRWFLLLGLPLLRRIPGIQDLPGVRGYFWVREIDLPQADLERLQRAVHPESAAFLGPNHPEFGFDWMMDKEISTRVAPRMASWAAANIIDTAPGFWLRNNLIANTGGEAAMKYSVDRALAGDAVLLHPEGSVHWTASRIHPLFGGIAEMACEAARRAGPGGRPVYIAPIVWSISYVDDISEALHAEMAHIERYLGMPESDAVIGERKRLDAAGRTSGPGRGNVTERFRALQESILLRQMNVFGFQPGWVAGLDFFARQDAFRDWLIEDLETRYSVERCDSVEKLLARFKRSIPPELKSDRAKVEEAMRLGGFCRRVYARKPLTQEQVAESLKRHRATLVRRGWKNVVHNYLPTPLGPRVVHVRVPEPILVDPVRAAREGAEYARVLLAMTHERMQGMLAADEVRVDQSPNFLSTDERISASALPSFASLPTKDASV
jgi:hypothetical protein